MRMAVILKNYRKRKINDTKDEDLYVDCTFIFESAARAERLLSHCKCIQTLPVIGQYQYLLKLLVF